MHHASPPSRLRRWASTTPALLILLFTVLQGTSEKIQATMIATGEGIWPGYAELRHEPEEPTCDPDAFKVPSAAADDDDLGDLFDDEEDDDEVDLDDLFDKPDTPPAADGDVDLDDLFDDEPAPGSDDDDIDDLFDDEPSAGQDAAQIAVERARAECEAKHTHYASLIERVTPSMRVYRAMESKFAQLNELGRSNSKFALVILILICATTATATRGHIALRPVQTRLDNAVAETSQLVVNLILIASCFAHYRNFLQSGVQDDFGTLPMYWAAGFAVMSFFNLKNLRNPPADLERGGSYRNALLTPPLYATMAGICAVWFIGFESYPSGMAIYIDKLIEHAALYIQVGLYVWAGMLLKRTHLAELAFDVLRPWRLAPELLACVVVIGAAIPTAYSGASGIFVIAAGAIIYEELRKAGARNQLALAATAMSGSLGVVLNPCLLVVIVASLNKQVTTAELFGAGRVVFALTAGLFVAVVLLTCRWSAKLAPWNQAAPESIAALKRLLPYGVVSLAVLAAYAWGLDTPLNEHSAPVILPILLLFFLLTESLTSDDEDDQQLRARVEEATTETTGHIGALLLLMALSVCLGGILERGEVMTLVPSEFGSVWATMGVLTVLLVGIGMVMDPYGAVILVSATLAHVAYDNGIAPLHFWMVVLVAFELGYLTPPVALNHLLTRQVVGDRADDPDVPVDASFYRRHERLLLPVSVMATALFIVAFLPLAW